MPRRSVTSPANSGQSTISPALGFTASPWGRYADVIAYSGFGIAHVEKATYSSELKSSGDGPRRRFHREDVDDWMRRGAPAGVASSSRRGNVTAEGGIQ